MEAVSIVPAEPKVDELPGQVSEEASENTSIRADFPAADTLSNQGGQPAQKGVFYKDALVPTQPAETIEEVIEKLKNSGWKLNGFKRDPTKFTITFEADQKGIELDTFEKRKQEMESWPDSPYIRAPGPSVQLVREDVTSKKGGCCSGPQPPIAGKVVTWLRPSANPEKGSQHYVKYTHDGDLKESEIKGCGCLKAPVPVNEWEFTNDKNETLKFRRMTTILSDEKKGKPALPDEGVLWMLIKDGETVASVEIPDNLEQVGSCCCKRKVPKYPRMWMRVFKDSGSTMYSIRDQSERATKKPCCVMPKCLSPHCCGPCRAACCGGPKVDCTMANCCCVLAFAACPCLCMSCCGPEARIPVYATYDGKASATKELGTAFRDEDDPSHLIQFPDLPAVAAIPAQESMVTFKFPGRAGRAATNGEVQEHGSIPDQDAFKEKKRLGKIVLDEIVANSGSQVKTGDIVAWAKVQKQCCGFQGCHIEGCSRECPCSPQGECYQMCKDIPICKACVTCCAMCSGCATCKPGAGPCGGDAEPFLWYEPSPVTGEWATGEKEPYRVRAEVAATKVCGDGGSIISEVVAGLEEGTPADDHMAFALVTFMELMEDSRRPNFHVETDPEPMTPKGLPPRQCMMLEEMAPEEA
mmetsp:Transcript_87007/g.153868  ORF Transcript_87007/g.153868 Transcript_87007/m.153868 type:complete len:639 (-) Transcript_87007:256-2172(-)|eukprot:CAMPEP_0197708864 /NCGR_PEP_ID=MMETSP1338-20131121/128166_1 /TAXON_ID=43686 ORGANISM="Pelagodinium beii, Strain RCC1491" /NCGR_SAMPLE_ID=MMETSP1338 /ASSEMBLY_ACC=CAM_ASM_000754 /LENGTH=638 /DNA_ID=CAMNT_0043292795 /DNA_START=52 /DNA_END=1968 /DNA_ORIENTATION=+